MFPTAASPPVQTCVKPHAAIALLIAMTCAGLLPASVGAQTPTLEYRVKAAYIYNFTKYVDWPSGAIGTGPLTICVAGRNPFGTALDELVEGEQIESHPLAVRVILEPEAGCHVLFVPNGAAVQAYLRGAQGKPILTIGEAPDFIAMGGIVNFVREEGKIRFEIDPQAAERASLRISSRVMRLARMPDAARRTP
jgi:hypothetical protein